MNIYSQAALKTRATREEHKTPANTRLLDSFGPGSMVTQSKIPDT